MNPKIRGTCASLALLTSLTAGLFGQDHPQASPNGGRPVRSPGNADWANNWKEAQSTAAPQKKLVFYEFGAPNCGGCQRMDGLLYPAFDFEALLIGMVPVKVELGSNDAAPLAERYKVKDVPSILITTPEGRLVFLMQGFKTAPEFYQHVHADLDRYRQFVKKIDAQDIPKLSAEEAYMTGRELYARSDPAAALPRLKRAAVAPKPQPGVRENALEGLAEVELELGDTKASREAIDKLAALTKDPAQKERAELFRAQLPLAEKKPAEALALYKQFLKDHPSSQYRSQVEGYIARLEGAAPAP